MKEQHAKFQKELEERRKQLQDRTTVTPDEPPPPEDSTKLNKTSAEDTIAIDDDSDDEMPQVQDTSVTQSSPLCSPVKSSVDKRPKRGHGGRYSST